MLSTMSEDNKRQRFEQEEGFALKAEKSVKTKRRFPSRYKIILLNDDFTPMDLVVHVLQKFFAKTLEEGTSIMLEVHQQGSGVCGIYPYDIAETKVAQVISYARKQGSPLQCRLEKVS